MPSVMPTQAVAAIDQLFPHVRGGGAQGTYSSGNASALRGIVNLVKQVPQELLILPSDQYADMVLGLGAIEEELSTWASRGDVGVLRPVKGLDPLVLVRGALLKCPDEYPPPSTADLLFISDPQLRESIRRDVGGANRAFHNAEWKAATVLAGAAIEALLHWKLGQLPLTAGARKVAASAVVSSGRLEKTPPANLDRWGLQDFIEVAGELKVIKSTSVHAANLARDFRNLIHPGVSASAEKSATGPRLSLLSPDWSTLFMT
jgi:hypothetical protein